MKNQNYLLLGMLVAVSFAGWLITRSGGRAASGSEAVDGSFPATKPATSKPDLRAFDPNSDPNLQPRNASAIVESFLSDWGSSYEIEPEAAYALQDALSAANTRDAVEALSAGIGTARSALAKGYLASALAALDTAEAADAYIVEICSESDPTALADMLDALPAFSSPGAMDALAGGFSKTGNPEILAKIIEAVSANGDEALELLLRIELDSSSSAQSVTESAGQILARRADQTETRVRTWDAHGTDMGHTP